MIGNRQQHGQKRLARRIGLVRFANNLGKSVFVRRPPGVGKSNLVLVPYRAVNNLKTVMAEKIVHIVKIPVAAVNPFIVISLFRKNRTDIKQVFVFLAADNRHSGQRRHRQRYRFDSPHRTRTGCIGIAEKQPLAGKAAQIRRNLGHAFRLILVQILGAHAFHQHHNHIGPVLRPIRTDMP